MLQIRIFSFFFFPVFSKDIGVCGRNQNMFNDLFLLVQFSSLAKFQPEKKKQLVRFLCLLQFRTKSDIENLVQKCSRAKKNMGKFVWNSFMVWVQQPMFGLISLSQLLRIRRSCVRSTSLRNIGQPKIVPFDANFVYLRKQSADNFSSTERQLYSIYHTDRTNFFVGIRIDTVSSSRSFYTIMTNGFVCTVYLRSYYLERFYSERGMSTRKLNKCRQSYAVCTPRIQFLCAECRTILAISKSIFSAAKPILIYCIVSVFSTRMDRTTPQHITELRHLSQNRKFAINEIKN